MRRSAAKPARAGGKRERGASRSLAARSALLVGLLAAVWAAGCSGEGKRTGADPGGERPDSTSGRGPEVSGSNLSDAKGAVEFVSREGGFKCSFPSGCSRIHTRTYPGVGQSPSVVQCYSDRQGRSNEGAMVTAYLDLKADDGGPPNPRTVTAEIAKLTRQYGVTVIEQRSFARDGMEGVRAFCREAGSTGVLWAQGMLIADHAYIMSAWRPGDGGLSDGEIAAFFGSFQLLDAP